MTELAAVCGFGVAMWAVGAWASRRVVDADDYAVAGRRLGLGLAFPTLLATWFGAGTLLVAADEVAVSGLPGAALDPLGAGLCLLLAGGWLARPLWRMKLSTLSDFFGRVYGKRAEWWSAWLMVPGYIGWIAAQLTALAGLLAHVAGVPWEVGLPLVTMFGVVYTVMGGMWAVAVTDALQIGLVVVGLGVVSWLVFDHVGEGDAWLGWGRTWAATDPGARAWIADPPGPWVAALAAGALGNLPGQDLTQRMFSARSEGVAQAACLLAGVAYLTLGLVPVALALAARWQLTPDEVEAGSVLITLVDRVGGRTVSLVFALTVAATVLSTIDSAILAPSTVLARNVLSRWFPESLLVHRVTVAAVGGGAAVLAWVGEDAYTLLETSYELGLVSLLVPLLLGVYRPGPPAACLASMGVGTASWVLHLVAGAEGFLGGPVPMGIGSALSAALAYAVAGRITR